MSMAFQSLVIATNAERAELLSDALLEAGALSVSVEDAHAGTAAEQPLFGEPGHLPETIWAESVVRALLDAAADATTILGAACAALEIDPVPAASIEHVPDDDWVARTQAQFEPIRVTPRLWIVPSWRAPVDPNAINLTLDPGLAFGTGSHATTQLCLRWLEAFVQPGVRVIDYGCGSGILALAAAKFGATSVLGVDIDAQAVTVAQANAVLNEVPAQIATFATTDAPIAKYTEYADLVVANILANPLRLLAPALVRLVKPGGRLALAGLLEEQADEIAAVYAPHLPLRRFATQDGWTCLAGVKPALAASLGSRA